MFRIANPICCGLVLLLLSAGASAQQDASSVTKEDLYQMLLKQQKLIENQQATIDSQGKALAALSTKMDQMAQAQPQTAGAAPAPPDKELQTLNERMAALEKQEQTRTGMPADVLTAGDFPGSIQLPGTNMAAKVGGNVRIAVVNNFDPIGLGDQFIAATIPVPGAESSNPEELFDGVNISAKRSLVNLDMRMDSSVGRFRAFVEGDFVSDVDDSNAFRLRHAYGQYKRFLLGQTWSTFMDLDAEPEELDFEGLNSQIFRRHPILRWTRGLGDKRRFSIAVEDPTPEIENGTGKSDVPDLVSTINFRRDSGHVQLGGVVRNIKGEQTGGPEGEVTRTETSFGWGLNFSGSHEFQKQKKDKVMWQVNFGEGIGAYINDLQTLGELDAVFSPDGNLEALPAFGAYVALQHYWHRQLLAAIGAKGLLRDLRSTFVYGYTGVDNFDFQSDDAYSETQRASINLIWSPIAPIDIGVEYMWGQRRNKDGKSGTANQLQFVATFNF